MREIVLADFRDCAPKYLFYAAIAWIILIRSSPSVNPYQSLPLKPLKTMGGGGSVIGRVGGGKGGSGGGGMGGGGGKGGGGMGGSGIGGGGGGGGGGGIAVGKDFKG